MKQWLLLIICTQLFFGADAQVRTVSGRLTSNEDGSPLPGVNIFIKGTTTGTTTDAHGNYSINVPVGATLVFSFIGLQTREVIVTETNLKPIQSKDAKPKGGSQRRDVPKLIPRSLYSDSTQKDTEGVEWLTDDTPTYRSEGIMNPALLKSVRRRGQTYVLKSVKPAMSYNRFAMQLTTSLGIEQVNKLPSLQNEYSQGSSWRNRTQWRGADQKEIFSWGPSLRALEFDGATYPFDKNGSLVANGTGNGIPAKLYDPTSFFRTAINNVSELLFTIPCAGTGTLVVDFESRTRTGVIPNSMYKKTNFSARLKNTDLGESLIFNGSVSYNGSTGNLLQRGANLSTIVGSVYRTPITFDNTNGQSGFSATRPESFLLFDGSKRSHAPGLADNPIGLANELPDHERLNRLMTTANLEYRPRLRWSVTGSVAHDQQWNKSVSGSSPGYSGYLPGRLTDRRENQMFTSANVTTGYLKGVRAGELNLRLSYQLQHTLQQLRRQDAFSFPNSESFGQIEAADSIVRWGKNLNRTVQEVIGSARYTHMDWLKVGLSNRSYFSNTVHKKRFINLFPSASASVDFSDLLGLWSFHDAQVYTAISRTLREAPLIYSNWAYGSTVLPVEHYPRFYEANELFGIGSLAPETELKFETGIKLHSWKFTTELAYYNNLTRNFLMPVADTRGINLANAASVRNSGVIAFIGITEDVTNGRWGIDLTWSTSRSVVKELNSGAPWLSMAGFQTARTVLAKGQPVGAIFGTTYTKNADGNRIIGVDGFPIEDQTMKMIGNPMPDWIAGLSSFIEWKKWTMSFVLNVKKGGDIWNGTQSVLDYLGRSSVTSQKRETTGYVFDGVDANGDVNRIPVDFYDPTKALAENRWVRYGMDGVGEDYIEDASWARLSELVLSWTSRQRSGAIKGYKISILGKNLFLISAYSGVDPAGTLFGYSSGTGLDLFNAPATRSYHVQLTIKM